MVERAEGGSNSIKMASLVEDNKINVIKPLSFAIPPLTDHSVNNIKLVESTPVLKYSSPLNPSFLTHFHRNQTPLTPIEEIRSTNGPYSNTKQPQQQQQ